MAGARSNPVAVPAGKKVEGTSAYEEASLGAFATSVPYEPARAHSVLEQQSPGEFSDTDRSEGQRSRSDSDVSATPRLLHPCRANWILVDAYRVMPLHIRSQAEQWELPRQELEFRSKIGAGRGGVAYQCSWRANFSMVDQLSPEWNDMISELSTISHLRHPNLVLFLGACTREGPLIILNEYLPGGNLEDYLNSRPRARGSYKVKLSVALGWGLDLARAICYLHNCNSAVVHRDLKPENLLLADDLRLKISDFGL
ncbi:kinase-like domain-containing protein [Baffinella frigidus]|nr:kinase-like domain-containing protein [Cryptophyta sp. CCMP2293]